MSDHVDTRHTTDSPRLRATVTASRPKRALKIAASSLARLLVMPLYASFLLRRAAFGEQAFRTSAQQLSLVPGFLGDYLRAEFFRLTLAGCGRDVQISFGTLFSSSLASVGDTVYIGTHCMIGNVHVGHDVLLGSNVHLLSGQSQHGIGDLATPIRLQERRLDRITIGEDTWIGNGAIVMANVNRKCVIGAGSVVVSDIPELSIAAGNPARVLRSRA